MADESSPVCVAPDAESGPSDSSEGQGRSSSDSCYVHGHYVHKEYRGDFKTSFFGKFFSHH